MLLNEFIELTNVEVSNEEFYAINLVYMNSDVDKFQFCKMWCKMNASRVKAAKEAKKKEEEENDNKWALANLYWCLHHELTHEQKVFEMFDKFASEASIKRVEKVGINTNAFAIDVMDAIANYVGV